MIKTPYAKADQPVDYGILPSILGYQLRRAQIHIFHDFAASFAGENITPGQMGLLILIRHNKGISQIALARAVGIERSTLGEVIIRLVKRGLVNRRQAKNDKRSYALSLSKQGDQFLDQLIDKVRKHEARLTRHMPAAEEKELMRLLNKVLNG